MSEIKLCESTKYGAIIYVPENSSCIKTYVLDDQGNDFALELEEMNKIMGQFDLDDEDTLTGIKPIKNLEFKVNNDIFITATKDDMIDISRTLALAISTGKAEYTISDGRKITVQIK